jgi:predicted nucleotide-binding protein
MDILQDQLSINPATLTPGTIGQAEALLKGYFAEEKERLVALVGRVDPPMSKLGQSDYAKLFLQEKRLADLFARFKSTPNTSTAPSSKASQPTPSKGAQETPDIPMDKETVFLVHGRNREAHDAMFAFLCALGLKPKDFDTARVEICKGSPSIPEVLKWGFANAWCVLVLITGDDQGRLHEPFWSEHEDSREKEYLSQPRLNVVFEAGMALSLKEDRTILVRIGETRSFSDIAGRYVHPFNGTKGDRIILKDVLRGIECDIEEGIDWLSAGDFQKAIISSARSLTPQSSTTTIHAGRPSSEGGRFPPGAIMPGAPESSFTLTEPAKGILAAAASKGSIFVFNPGNAAGYIIKVEGEVFSDGTDAFASEEYFEVLGFLVGNGLARKEGEHIYQLTARGFKLARNIKA